jgi:hypothetical protein
MKYIIILCLLTVCLLSAGSVSTSENTRISLIADQMYQDQSSVWPTLNWKTGPLIVTFDNGHIYAFNLKTEDPSWQKVKVGENTVLYAEKDNWGVLPLQMQSEFEIEGQQAFIYHMKMTDSSLHDVSILAHERFHRHQGEEFTMKEGQGASLDHLSVENLTWGDIEDQLLRDFLKSTNEEKIEHLKDYISVNHMRREAIDPLSVQWENGQLRMEGLADYVSTKAYGGESLLLAMHPEVEHEDDFVDEAIKWRHYMAGAAIGYGLDYIGVTNWKAKAEQGEPLADILYTSMPISKSEQDQRIKKVQKKLNNKKRRKSAQDKLDQHHDQLAELEEQYEKSHGVKMFLGRPPVSISGGGANDSMVYLDNGSIVALNDASIATTSDGKWSFETKRVSHLFQHLKGVREVKVDKMAAVLINDVWYSLEELLETPKEYPFTALKIECKDSFLNSVDHPGILVADSEGLHIKYL